MMHIRICAATSNDSIMNYAFTKACLDYFARKNV